MIESSGKRSDHPKAQCFPQGYGTQIATDDKIELHGAKAKLCSFSKRFLSHQPPCTKAGTRNESRVADVTTAAFLVRLKIKRPDDLMIAGLGNINAVLDIHPVGECLTAPPVSGQGICFALPQYRRQQAPDSFTVQRLGRANQKVSSGSSRRRHHDGAFFRVFRCATGSGV